MRRFAYLLMVVSGCGGTPDPCSGQSGVCISARIEGNAKNLNSLRFTVPATKMVSTSSPSSSFSPPVLVGLLLPDGTADGQFDILCEGLRGTDSVAGDSQTVTTSNKRGSVTFTLNEGTTPDLSMTEPGDMLMPDLLRPSPMLVPSPAMPMGRELEPITFTVTASDPLNMSPSTSMSMLPTGAMATTGQTSTFTWTPSYIQAGSYNVSASVMTSDNRTAGISVPVVIANAVDVAPILNPNDVVSGIPPIDAIGDFDGDGFGDLAGCTIVGTNYVINLLYGDPSGLPTNTVIPAGRAKTYMFGAVQATNTASNTRLRCHGADMDGDGKRDIILQDPGANTVGAGPKGQIYIFFGVDRNTATSTAVTTVDNTNTGEVFDQTIFVGHYSAGNRNDFAIRTSPNNSGVTTDVDRINIFHGRTTKPSGTTWDPPEILAMNAGQNICGTKRQLIGFGDFDMNANNLDELLVWDKNVGVTGAGDCPNRGGFSVISSTLGAKLFVRPPGASFNNWGLPPTSTFCDVDGDGAADLVVSTDAAALDSKAEIYFAPFPIVSPSPAPPTLDSSMAAIVAAPAGRVYAEAHCAKKFFQGPFSLLLIDDGDASTPARVDVIGSSRTPAVLQSLPNPDPSDKKFGTSAAGECDIDGDGKGDLILGSPMGRYWAVYGR